MSSVEQRLHGRYLNLKCFLEGVDIPVVSCSVQGGMGMSAVCNIVIPYNDMAHKLKPRSLVHLFIMDTRWESGQSSMDADGNMYGTNYKAEVETDSAFLTDANNLHNYKLVFTGEVMAYDYTKVGDIRQITLICQDFSKYWQDAKLYWGRRNTSLHSYKQAIFSGATQLYRGRSRVDSSNDLIRLLRATPSANKNIPGLLGGLIATLESVTGVFSPDATRRYRGVNDYMSQAELRLHLTRMLGASEQDDSSSTFINSSSFRRYLRRVTRQVKSTASFYDLMGLVLSKCYQKWNSVPCPPYIYESRLTFEYLQRVSGFNYRNNSDVNAVYQQVEATYNLLTERVQHGLVHRRRTGNDDETTTIPNTSDYIMNMSDNSGGAVVDAEGHDTIADGLNSGWGNNRHLSGGDGENSPMQNLRDELHTSTGATGGARRAARLAGDGLTYAAQAMQEVDELREDEVYNNPNARTHTAARYNSVRQKLANSLDSFRRAAGVTYRPREVTVDVRSRLHCFLFHPDIYMMPPPKCNVVFPDQVQAIKFTRRWMSEVTRIWLHGRTSSGRDRRNCYFSPNTSILGITNVENGDDVASEAVRKGQGFLMPHEKFTGVISAIVGLGDNDIFRRLHVSGLAEAREEAREAGEDEDVAESNYTASAETSPQPHMQRAANYMFFENRYSGRNLQATLRYSPQLVAGMPILILDPLHGKRSRIIAGTYSDTFDPGDQGAGTNTFAYNPYHTDDGSRNNDEWARRQSSKPRGTHYVGILDKVAHVANANGGAQTKVSLTHVREHNEIANIFATADEDGNVQTKMVKRVRRSARVRPSGNRPGGSNGIHNGNFLAADQQHQVGGQRVYTMEASEILGAQYRRGASYEITPVVDSTNTPLLGPPLNYAIDRSTGLPLNQSIEPQDLEGVSRDERTGNAVTQTGVLIAAPHAQVIVRRVWYESIPTAVDFTFEQIARPPWMANIFTSANIGNDYYQKMIGCGSVLDGNIPIVTPNQNLEDLETNSSETIEAETIDTDGDGSMDQYTLLKIPFKVEGRSEEQDIYVPRELMEPGKTTQSAADALAEVWLGLKEIGADVNRFIDTYTQRSMATVYDIMGTVNPAFSWNSVGDAQVDPRRWHGNIPNSQFTFGPTRIEGFHSWAFGQLTGLNKLDESGAETPLTGADERLTTVDPATEQRDIDANVDTRLQRHNAARAYVEEMRAMMGNRTGIAGGGLINYPPNEDVIFNDGILPDEEEVVV